MPAATVTHRPSCRATTIGRPAAASGLSTRSIRTFALALCSATRSRTSTLPSRTRITRSMLSSSADTDVGAFLQSGVPAELAAPHYAGPGRATPRFAISSASPRINGDFNDPDAIPGLGPLLATDGVPAVLTQVSSKSENITEAVRESPVSAKLNRSCIADPEPKLDEPCSAESGNRFTEQSDRSGRGNGEKSHR